MSSLPKTRVPVGELQALRLFYHWLPSGRLLSVPEFWAEAHYRLVLDACLISVSRALSKVHGDTPYIEREGEGLIEDFT